MRSTRAFRGAVTVLLAGMFLVAATGTTAAADEPGRGNGKAHGKDDSKRKGSSKGANSGCGEYCSTRDGSPSRNGNGGGKATGRPCAGCVGRADDKNPPGQYPNGSDANNGYECDGNAGIARSNPAHTGCSPSTSVAPAPQPAPLLAPAAPAPKAGPAAAYRPFRYVGSVGAKAPAEAATDAAVAPRVLGTRFERAAVTPGAAGSRGGALPFTGATTAGLLLAAAALVGTGAVLTRAGAKA